MGNNAGNNSEFLRDLMMDSFYLFGFLVFFDIASDGWLRYQVSKRVGPLVERAVQRIALEKEVDRLLGHVLWDAMQTVEQSETGEEN